MPGYLKFEGPGVAEVCAHGLPVGSAGHCMSFLRKETEAH